MYETSFQNDHVRGRNRESDLIHYPIFHPYPQGVGRTYDRVIHLTRFQRYHENMNASNKNYGRCSRDKKKKKLPSGQEKTESEARWFHRLIVAWNFVIIQIMLIWPWTGRESTQMMMKCKQLRKVIEIMFWRRRTICKRTTRWRMSIAVLSGS